MLRRLATLFVGVLAAVGVSVQGLEPAPATTLMSKHWPPRAYAAVGVGVGILLAWTMAFAWTMDGRLDLVLSRISPMYWG